MAHVLVVEGDPLLRHVLGRLLRRAGYSVSLAANGEEALNSVEEPHPGLIVADVPTHTVDGPALIRRLKSEHAATGVQVLVITDDEVVNESEACAAACDHVIAQPFLSAELVAKVNRLLRPAPDPEEPEA